MDIESGIDFDTLEPADFYFTYRKVRYVMREATAAAAKEWRNFQSACRRFDPETGGLVVMLNLADCEPLLLSRCIFEVGALEELRPVKQETLASWGSRVTTPLYQKLLRISGLGQEDDTPDSLRRRIKQLQLQLERLEGPGKNGAAPTGASSTTASGSGDSSTK